MFTAPGYASSSVTGSITTLVTSLATVKVIASLEPTVLLSPSIVAVTV